jgi:RNase P subunit RPR2
MKLKFSKSETASQIEEFFSDIKNKTPKEIKKIKRIAMKYNIPLREKRKLFCKKCLKPFTEPGIRIKNGIITITCENCSYKNRWKIK